MSIEAMKQALEALEHDNPAGRSATITALHQAIEQAEKQDANEWYEKALWGDKQEPVAIPEGFSLVAVKGFHDLIYWLDRCERKGHLENCPDLVEPYESFDYRIIDDTAPPQREWVGLSRGKKLGIIDRHTMRSYDDQQDMLFAIMADTNDLLKNKNASGWQSVANPTQYLDELRGGEAT